MLAFVFYWRSLGAFFFYGFPKNGVLGTFFLPPEYHEYQASPIGMDVVGLEARGVSQVERWGQTSCND